MKKITPKQYALSLYEASLNQEGEALKVVFNNFLKIVWRNKDWKNLNKIIVNFEKVINDKNSLLKAEVVSAIKLSDQTLAKVQSWLESCTHKTVTLSLAVQQDLLGGLVVKYDDVILDSSLKTQLKNLQINLNK